MNRKLQFLPPVMLVLGLAACFLHHETFTHLDAAQILVRGSLPEILLWVVTAAAALAAFVGHNVKFGASFAPVAAAGDLAFAVGIYTLLQFEAKGPEPLKRVYQGVILLAIVCLVVMAVMRLLGKTPFYILHLGPSLLCLAHLVECYQLWSEKPLLLDYFFGLGAVLCLMLSAYHRLAAAAKLPEGRDRTVCCLLGIFFCTVAVMQVEFPIFFASGVVWLLANATAVGE